MENIKETIMENENVMDAVIDAVESGSSNVPAKGIIAGVAAIAAGIAGVVFWRKHKADKEKQQFDEAVVVEGEVVEVTDK